MGSFNESCAISNLPILWKDKIRQFFLVENSSPSINGRGIYVDDKWFVRTPSLKGTYDDYGRCELEPTNVIDSIVRLFDEEVYELPFGFNQYHDVDVTKNKGLDHYFNAAQEGRLQLPNYFYREEKHPERFPTWKKIHDILRNLGFPIQLDSLEKVGQEGYNAQQLVPGVVCLSYVNINHSLGQRNLKLFEAQEILQDIYYCKIFEERNERVLLIYPKDTERSIEELFDKEKAIQHLKNPEYDRRQRSKLLRVCSVMVREDVWQSLCKIENELTIKERINKTKKHLNSSIFDPESGWSSRVLETSVITHIKKEENEEARDEMIQSYAELLHIQDIMFRTNRCWYVPTLGRQDSEWDLQLSVFSAFSKIARKEKKLMDEEY